MRSKTTIWGHSIVKNEDNYIWFSLMSVINYLDKILVYDTGSTDNTKKIINIIKNKYPDKIVFVDYGPVDEEGFTKARQDMLSKTKSDWVFLLDGDEVWWEDSLKKTVNLIQKENQNLEFIVNPCINLIGDIYHFQDDAVGEYKLLGRKGHMNIRAVNMSIDGLHFDKPYGSEGFFDKDNLPIQDREPVKAVFIDSPYLHFSHLSRSSHNNSSVMQRSKKIKYELGSRFDKDFKYPEVFYQDYPDIVVNPWKKISTLFKARALFETPFRKLKRKIKR